MTVWFIYSWGLMERIDRSEGNHLWNIGKEYSEFPFMISCSSFMQICCLHLLESDYNCAKLKDQSKGILKDWSGLWQKSPTVVRGAQSLWQNPSETHPETPKTPFRYVYMSTCHCPCQGHKKHQKKSICACQLSMCMLMNLWNYEYLTIFCHCKYVSLKSTEVTNCFICSFLHCI